MTTKHSHHPTRRALTTGLGAASVLAALPSAWGRSSIDRNLAWPGESRRRVLEFHHSQQQAQSTPDTKIAPGWGLEHSFDERHYIRRAKIEACKIIIQNGFFSEAANWMTLPFATERLTFFTYGGRLPTALTRAQAIAVLSGAIGNWREVGGADMPVTLIRVASKHYIYYHGRIGLYLKRVGLDPEVVYERTKAVVDYAEAAKLLRETSGSLAIGLRGPQVAGLTPVAIDGIVPVPDVATPDYPFQYQVAFSYRTDADITPQITYLLDFVSRNLDADRTTWERIIFNR